MQQQDTWDGLAKGIQMPLVSEVPLPFSLSQLINTGPSGSNGDEDWLSQFTRTHYGPGEAGGGGHPPVAGAAPPLQTRLQLQSAPQQYAGRPEVLLGGTQAVYGTPAGLSHVAAATSHQILLPNRVVMTSLPEQPRTLEQQVHQLSEELSHATVEDNGPTQAAEAQFPRDPSPARLPEPLQPAILMPDPLAHLTYLNNLSKRQRSERSVLTFEEYEAQYGPSLRCATGPCADTCSTPCKAHLCKCCKLHRRVENTGGGSRGKGYCGKCARRERVVGMEFVKCSHESTVDGKPVRCGVEMLREVFDNHWKQHKSELPPQFEELEIDEGRSCHACTNMRPFNFYPNQDTNCSCNHCQIVKSRGNKTASRDVFKADDSAAAASSHPRRASRGPTSSTPAPFPAPSSNPAVSTVDNTYTSHTLSPAAFAMRASMGGGQMDDPLAATSQPSPNGHADTSAMNAAAMGGTVNRPAPLVVPGADPRFMSNQLYGDGVTFQAAIQQATPQSGTTDAQGKVDNAAAGGYGQPPVLSWAGVVTTADGQMSPPAVHPLQSEEQLAAQTQQLLTTALNMIHSAAPSFHMMMHKLRYVHSPPGCQQAHNRQALLQQLLTTCNSIQHEMQQMSQGLGYHLRPS